MTKFTTFIITCFIMFSVQAQISGTKTIGPTGDYATLTSAFAAINLSGVSAPVILELQSNYNPGAETYPIAPGQLSGTSGSKTILVRPAAGISNILISASTTQVLNLNGTKYLTIDGRPGGTGNGVITFRNISSTGQVLRFINDAAYNSINYITAESNNSNLNGVIIFSTSTGSTGNSFNTISNCNVRNRSDIAGNPAVLIYSAGTNAAPNSSNNIIANNLFNANQRGIYCVSSGLGNNWVISNNSFYHTGGSVSSTYYGMHISAGNGFTIAGNYIGGTAPLAGGTVFENTGVVTNSYQFMGMALFFGNSALNTVQNNVIKNHLLSSTGATNGGGIGVFSGLCNVAGNTIENIASSHGGQFVSIQFSGTGTVSNNSINTITKTNTNEWYGILASNSSSVTINGNTINDITSATSGNLYAIYSETSQAVITNNDLHNISFSGAIPGNVYGIMTSGNFPINISRNKIYNLGVTTSAVATDVTGIYYPGFNAATEAVTIANNMVTLGYATSGSSQYKGIHDAGLTGNNVLLFNNSVFIDGTSTGGNTSYAFVKTGASNEVHRNNIYYNKRYNPSDVDHSISFVNNSGTISSNYNLLVAPTNTVGKWGTTSYSFAAYKVNALLDTTSYTAQVADVPASDLFLNVASGDLRIDNSKPVSWYVNGKGIAGAGSGNIATDFSGNVRSILQGTPTDIGAHEFSTATLAISATASAAPSAGATTVYHFGGRKLGEITWGNSGVLPSSVDWKYFSGIPSDAAVAKINSYENITAIGGSGYSYDLKLYYTDAENNGINDNDLAMLKKETSSWQFSGTPVNNLDQDGKFLLTSGQTFSSVSDFSLGVNVPLPVSEIIFSGTREAGLNKLLWSVASELKISRYEIERSLDGISFITRGMVHAGNKKEYNFVDKDLPDGKLFYRIRQVAMDGQSKWSNVIMIGGEKSKGLSITNIFPNPVADQLHAAIEADRKEMISLSIFDLYGRMILNTQAEIQEGVQHVQWQVSQLPGGLYRLKLTGSISGNTSFLSFIKQ